MGLFHDMGNPPSFFISGKNVQFLFGKLKIESFQFTWDTL